MKRYRFRRDLAPKVALRVLMVAVACAGIPAGMKALWGPRAALPANAPANRSTPAVRATPAAAASGSAEGGDAVTTVSEAQVRSAGCLVLINHNRRWQEGLLPPELVDMRQYCTSRAYALKDSAMRADKTAAQALDRMLNAAATAGMRDIVVMSAYRGHEKQRILFEQQVALLTPIFADTQRAQTVAAQSVARPGASEHHTGLAFDLAIRGMEMEQFGETAQGRWVREHCAQYGFILRYEPHKFALTGVMGEPWHFRYVGEDAAQKMQQNGWCLEEYVKYNP
jgi:D-alanyl-D-alanine carboxypeptidase